MAVDPAKYETKDMRIERLERELRESNTERDALRIIASDHLAGSDFTVKPEDAADVARWAAHPEAVRELLRHTPWHLPEDRDYENDSPNCAGCTAVSVWNDADDAHARDCPIAAAWRALGDPRGAADIERAWEEALTMARQRSDGPHDAAALLAVMARMNPNPYVGIAAEDLPEGATVEFGLGGSPTQPVRRVDMNGARIERAWDAALREQGALANALADDRRRRAGYHFACIVCGGDGGAGRMPPGPPCEACGGTGRREAARIKSDARGMEAVEDEARDLDARRPYVPAETFAEMTSRR